MSKAKMLIGWLIVVAASATFPVRAQQVAPLPQGNGVAVGYRQLGAVDVPSGVVSNVESVVLGDQSKLYKTGAGTLAVDGGALKSVTDARLNVLEGNVSVTTSADADFTTPPDACNLAAFWVNESSVATTNGIVEEGETAPTYVSKWLDVRETNPESPTLHYALPKWCTSDAYPATLYGIDPVPVTFDGRPSVYFGGRESGQYMRWYKDGSAVNISRIRHVFIVQAITNCVGHIIGKTDAGRTGPYLNSIGSQTMAYGTDSVIAYPRADICKPSGSAGYFLDGKKIDARFTVPKRAWQLWEIDYYDYLPAANNFGYCGFQEGTILKGRQGMDYVGEVVVFTNQLKEAERAAVERYLLAKWDLPQRKQNLAFRPASTELALAEGASATVSGAGGTVSKPIAIAGAGTVTKDGDGTLALGPTDGLGFTGDFIWNAGKVRFQGGNLPPLTVSAREKYAFNNYNGTSSASLAGDAASGITCTKTTDAEAGTVQTTGNGWLRVHTVSNNVKKIKVGMGTANLGSILQLEGRTRTLATGPTAGGARATFPNPDLEIPFAISDTQFDRKSVSSGNTLNGWTSRAGTFNIMCTQAPRSARTWAQWVGETVEIPRPGTNILQQVGAGTFSTTVSVPAAGTYELSFDASSRYSYNSGTSINTSRNFFYADQQPQAEILFGQTWAVATTNRVGDMPLGCRSFERYRYRIEVPEAGSWILGFRTVDSGGDACLFMDNFEMVRVVEPTTEETFKIPNGNFDRLVRPTSGASLYHPYVHGKFCTLNEIEGWTLSVMNPNVYCGNRLTNGVIGAVTGGMPITLAHRRSVPEGLSHARGQHDNRTRHGEARDAGDDADDVADRVHRGGGRAGDADAQAGRRKRGRHARRPRAREGVDDGQRKSHRQSRIRRQQQLVGLQVVRSDLHDVLGGRTRLPHRPAAILGVFRLRGHIAPASPEPGGRPPGPDRSAGRAVPLHDACARSCRPTGVREQPRARVAFAGRHDERPRGHAHALLAQLDGDHLSGEHPDDRHVAARHRGTVPS